MVQMNSPKIFISHSSKDEKVAELLADLLKIALRLPASDIRCTSVSGYKLPGGAAVDSQLRDEILQTKVVIGLISRVSFSSAYVLFELGARWGAKSELIPLLLPKTTPSDLQGPIKGYSPLKIDDSSQLNQLVSQVAEIINVAPDRPETYQRQIDKLIKASSETNNSSNEESFVADPSDTRPPKEKVKKFVPVQLFPGIGNAKIKDRYLDHPSGIEILKGKEFYFGDLIFDTNSQIRYFLPLENGGKEVEIKTDSSKNIKAVLFLANSGNSKGIYKGATIGKIILQFKDALPIERSLILGHNIREWSIGSPGKLVRELNDPLTSQIWHGMNIDGVNAIIDCIEIPIFECMKANPLEKIKIIHTPTNHPTDELGVHFSIFAISLEIEV